MDLNVEHPVTCKQCRRSLLERCDEQLSPQRELMIRRHLAECISCLEYAEQIEDTQRGLRSLPLVRMPSNGLDSILAATVQRPAARFAPVLRRRLTAGLAAAAVLALVVTLALWSGGSNGFDPQTRRAVEEMRFVLALTSEAVQRVQVGGVENVVERQVPEALQQLFGAMQGMKQIRQ